MTAIDLLRKVKNRALGAALREAVELEAGEERASWLRRFVSGREKGAQGDLLRTETMLALPLATALVVIRRQGEQVEELKRRIDELEKGDEAA